MRSQATFVYRVSMGDMTNGANLQTGFDVGVNRWIDDHTEPKTEIVRHLSTAVSPIGDGVTGYPVVVITLMLEYIPKKK